ncbi:hypothetical protein [Bacillus safensis]|uniref:hypothetical protein n=1 Tax=Bacillus safensis TaxID=561879 RepID=UPI0003F7B0FE|nr:hypothetical protein [Bacillus safensis]
MCNVCDVIKSINDYSVEYLSWITAIVGGIIALTTIVFTHYNERSIERSNELIEEIMSLMQAYKDNLDELPYDDLTYKFNKTVQALSNNHVYRVTLTFFEIILYILSILWWFGSLGYALNADTWIERILIIIATFILIAVFLFIPEIVKTFNKNKTQIVTNKNTCSYNEAIKFFMYKDLLTENSVVANLVVPTLRITINTRDQIIFEYSHGLMISDYYIIYKLVHRNKVIHICLKIDSGNPTVKFTTDSSNGITYRGLYELLRNANKTNGNLTIFNNVTSEKKIFKLRSELNSDGKLILDIKSNHNLTNVVIDELIKKETSFIKLTNGHPNDEKDYPLKKLS